MEPPSPTSPLEVTIDDLQASFDFGLHPAETARSENASSGTTSGTTAGNIQAYPHDFEPPLPPSNPQAYPQASPSSPLLSPLSREAYPYDFEPEMIDLQYFSGSGAGTWKSIQERECIAYEYDFEPEEPLDGCPRASSSASNVYEDDFEPSTLPRQCISSNPRYSEAAYSPDFEPEELSSYAASELWLQQRKHAAARHSQFSWVYHWVPLEDFHREVKEINGGTTGETQYEQQSCSTV